MIRLESSVSDSDLGCTPYMISAFAHRLQPVRTLEPGWPTSSALLMNIRCTLRTAKCSPERGKVQESSQYIHSDASNLERTWKVLPLFRPEEGCHHLCTTVTVGTIDSHCGCTPSMIDTLVRYIG